MLDFTSSQDWSFPVPITYGPGRIKELARLCLDHGMKKPFLVTDKGSADLPFIAAIMADLSAAGMDAALYSDISPNPRDTEIIAGRKCYLDGGHDGVIAIGGGSGMDGGKAISLVVNNTHDIWAFEWEKTPPAIDSGSPFPSPFPPLICIPTTAGTGAETESTAMVTDTELMMKWCIVHPLQKPVAVILDPELTLGLPPKLTAWTGVDALVHAVEAYVINDFHPLCDGAALEAMRLIYPNLPLVYKYPEHLEARGAMLVGSCLAGVSFIKGLGLVHAISHMVGAEYDTHHGLTNAITLPAVLRFNADAISAKVPDLTHMMGLSDHSFDGFYGAICDWLDLLDIPKNLSELGIPDDAVSRLAEKTMKDSAYGTNPKASTQAEIETLIMEALHNGR
jgi:alcohol dehydrogenase class IV